MLVFINRRLITVLLLATLISDSCKKDADTTPEPPSGNRPVTASSSAWVTDFVGYNPGPGQFINTSLGNDSAARGILKNDQGSLSLGSWGGYVIYGFDHTVINKNGNDIFISGNAFPQFAEPGVVWVMKDINTNSKADDQWYELAGSETGNSGYLRNYAVTYFRPSPSDDKIPWKDNQGDSGFVLTNMFYGQHYYPDVAKDSYTLTGTRLPVTNIDARNAAYIISKSFQYGYADNSSGGDSLDIGSAIDSLGKPVTLEGIDFIKIQTGILADMGSLGEQSTEVGSIADISLLR
jgi:hypothetical protein